MPLSNFRVILIVIIISLICLSRTSIREQVLLNAYRKIRNVAFVAPSEKDVFEGALEGMTAKLRNEYGDGYSAYENAKDQQRIRDNLENQLVGLGVSMLPLGKSRGVQLFPLPNSPALDAGVQYGDTLLQIDGDDVTGLALREISQKLSGESGSKVTLLVRHFDADENTELIVTRARMHLPCVLGDRLDRDGKWIYTLETAPEIGYVAIDKTFSDTTAVETATALAELKKLDAKGVIVDLRGNPGGYLNAAVDVCNLFLNKGTIVTTQQRHTSETITAKGVAIWDRPVVVLVDSYSASAAEIVAACFQDHGIAVVVGTRSYGKGTVQEMIELPLEMGTLRLTKAEYLRPSQKNINRRTDDTEDDEWGVLPNEGYALVMSNQQANVTYRIRNLRAIIPAEELDRQVERLVRRIREGESHLADDSQMPLDDGNPMIELPVDETAVDDETAPDKNEQSTVTVENKDDDSEGPTVAETETAFSPEGTPPYYDPQLDLAIEYLLSLQK